MANHVFNVPGISCDHCRAAIEGGVSAVPGVADVTVDIDDRQAIVTGSADVAAVIAAIEQAGYEVVSEEAGA